jgi:hypothetical protein
MSARHPVIGSWQVAVDVGSIRGPTNLATLSSDGTVIVTFPSPTAAAPGTGRRLEFWTPAFGSWTATGDDSAAMTFLALGCDENGTPIGTHTVSANVTATGSTPGWQGPFRIDVTGPEGTALGSVSGTVTATPIAAESSG